MVKENPKLKRNLTLSLLTFYGIGNIIGAGIYVLIGEVAGAAGLYTPIAFVLASILAGFSAFSFAELSSRMPKSAGEAVYIQKAFGIQNFSILIGLMVAITGIIAASTIVKGFTGYLDVFVLIPHWISTGFVILLLGGIAAWGIKQSAIVATIVSLLEIGGILFVLWVGKDLFLQVPERLPELVPLMGLSDGGFGIMLGAFLAFFAFVGFEDMVNVAEEVKNPTKNMPRAIIIALIVVTILYFLVSLLAVLAVPLEDLSATTAPLALIFQNATGEVPIVISLIALFAVTNGAMIQIIMSSRILYGLSSHGWIPELFGRIHPKTHTPLISTSIITGIILILSLSFPIGILAQMTSFIILSVFTIINLALWKIKTMEPAPDGVKVYPIWVPIVGFFISLGFVLFRAAEFFGLF